jgi:hypothetical protein
MLMEILKRKTKNSYMKILKLGNIKFNVKPVKKTCHNCKTQFEYENQDIQSDRDGKYIVCPNPFCGKFITV